MNSEISDQNLNADLHEPHFDDEATVLAARRVVPLDEVKTSRSKRGFALGVAITVGLLVGAAVAIGIFRYLDRRQDVRIEAASVESGAASEDGQLQDSAGGTTVDPVENSVVKSDETVPVAPTSETTKTQPPAESKPNTDSRVVKREDNENATSPDDDDDEAEKQLRRAERKRERQLQRQAERQAKREARGRDNAGSNDDLLRIREIFEGSPRP
jgi:flagellar biosynthesis GTPase FlhF